MSEFLRALELILDELPRLLSSDKWEALKTELMPLLERYRTTGDPDLVQQILAVFHNHPEAERLLPQARYRPDEAREAAPDVAIEDLTRIGFKRAIPPNRFRVA